MGGARPEVKRFEVFTAQHKPEEDHWGGKVKRKYES